ncbi:MAG: S9 family peptidase [Acidobacteriota bacterium]
MKRLFASALMIVLALGATFAQSYRPFTINDLIPVRRAGDPQLSPDGRWIAFTITDTDFAANRRTTQIYLVSIEGGEIQQLTKEKQSSVSPRWSPDGKRIAFVSARDGAPQIWTLELAEVATGPLRKITNISTGADNPVWSSDGNWIAFTSEVYPDCPSDDCNRQRDEQMEANKVKARVADRLLYRHWNQWEDGKRAHVFVVPASGGEAKDMTEGDWDTPPFSLGGPTDYAFSPDGRELAFARNTDKDQATSTNGDIFTVSLAGGEAKRITGANKGADLSPQYSPDGRFLAYRSQARAGFESDRWRLMLHDRKSGVSKSISDALDSSVESFTFSPDSQKVFLTALDRGRQCVYTLSINGGAAKKIISDGTNDDVQITRDGRTLIFTRNSLTHPVEIFRASSDGSGVRKITSVNDAHLAPFNLKPAEDVTWTGALGTKIHGFLIKPADFTPDKKWPLIVLIHGGPQGAWNDSWSYRWNPQVFASSGYVVFAPNPRGSTGYGQRLTNEISGDWAGKVYIDLMNGVAHLASKPYIDRARVGAAGGSYGGYMVNWILGHNTDPRVKFKALVSHAGVYNLTSMYGSTEELWFTDWEFKGTPWTNPQMYARWSPHLAAKNFRTPTLVIHGELDYRVPYTEGLQLFTALQRQGVESKLLVYTDEGHWILKPQNSKLWYDTVMGWFDKHIKGQP